jgi:hypothetical protein
VGKINSHDWDDENHCVQTNAAIPQLLQPNVMHNFDYITSGHVCPLFIIILLQIKEKSEMLQWKSK